MKRLSSALVAAVLLCLSAPVPAAPTAAAVSPAAQVLAIHTPMLTASGRPFVAVKGWAMQRRGPMVLLTSPEGDSRLALVDIEAGDADTALAQAWAQFDPAARWPLKKVIDLRAHGGWEPMKAYTYQDESRSDRLVFVRAMPYRGTWTLLMFDLAQGIDEERFADLQIMEATLEPQSIH